MYHYIINFKIPLVKDKERGLHHRDLSIDYVSQITPPIMRERGYDNVHVHNVCMVRYVLVFSVK